MDKLKPLLHEKDKDGRSANQYFNYVVVSCAEPNVSLSSETNISREKLGYMVIAIDLTCIFLTVLYIWYLEFNIKSHLKLHEKQTVQTKDYALSFNNLP